MAAGRPSDYTPELGALICDKIADGASTRKACSGDGMPSISAFMRWLEKYPELREHYARARSIRAESRFEELEEILADVRSGVLEPHAGRVLVDAIKWQMGKESPKVYGEKTIISGDADAPLQVQQAISGDDLAKRIAFMLVNKPQENEGDKALAST